MKQATWIETHEHAGDFKELAEPIVTTLDSWDFNAEAANSTLPQVNRQKSARNLFVRKLDRMEPRAVFFDSKRNQIHTTTLKTCDCVDFQRQRTVVRPCMETRARPSRSAWRRQPIVLLSLSPRLRG